MQTEQQGYAIGPVLKAKAETFYPIVAPTLSHVVLRGSTPVVDYPGHGEANCAVGNACIRGGEGFAAVFGFTATTPSQAGAGQIAVGQLINDSQTVVFASNGQAQTNCTFGQYWLDNGFPYPLASPVPLTSNGTGLAATYQSGDDPNLPEDYTVFNSASRSFSATDYYMYQATPTAARPSIWTTLKEGVWSFADSWTVQALNPLTLEVGVPVAPAGVTVIAPADSTTLPYWPGIAQPGTLYPQC
jgi:hypothetical protein